MPVAEVDFPVNTVGILEILEACSWGFLREGFGEYFKPEHVEITHLRGFPVGQSMVEQRTPHAS